MVAAYLRNDKPAKAAENWKKLTAKIDDYVAFCQEINKKEPAEINRIYGNKAADNMKSYTREWIDGKLQFMLGQLKSLSAEEVFDEFEKLID